MYMRGIIYTVGAIVVLLLINPPLYALEGEVSGAWTRDMGNIIVSGHIILNSDDSLLVEAGVQVYFMGNYRFTINGVLVAVGTADDPIVFRSNNPQAGAWLGMIFNGRLSSGSVMDYCEVHYAYKNITIQNGSEAMIKRCHLSNSASYSVHIDDASGTVDACTIILSETSGIAIEGNSFPTIMNSQISDCQDHGISTGSSCTPTVRANFITDVSDHGMNIAGSNAVIEYNYVINVGQRGINLSGAHNARLHYNIVDMANGPYGIEVYRSNSVQIVHNTIYRCAQAGIHMYASNSAAIINSIIAGNDGYGIDVQQSNPLLSYNDVWGNGRGNYNGLERGGHDISEDPALEGDYIPAEGSPVIDAGDPGAPHDPDGTRADIGAKFHNQNIPPTIVWYSPDRLVRLDGGGEVEFEVSAVDSNDHPLTYTWTLNGGIVQQGLDTTCTLNFNRDGNYTVAIVVDDGYYRGQTRHEWSFVVENAAAPSPDDPLPADFIIGAPYPNPFNAITRFTLQVGRAGAVRIAVWDLKGGLIRIIYQGRLPIGTHPYQFNAKGLPSGEYILTLQTEDGVSPRKLLLVK